MAAFFLIFFFFLNLKLSNPKTFGILGCFSSTHHLDLRHRRDLPRDFSLGSTSPLTNVPLSSSSCLQSLLLYSVSLLISVRPRRPRALFAHSEDGRRAARLDACGCKKKPAPSHKGATQAHCSHLSTESLISWRHIKVVRSRRHYLLAHCGSQSSCWL